MKDTNGHNQQNEPGGPEGPPERPTVTYTPQERNLIRKGLRIWVRVAIRSYMKRHGLTPDGTALVPDDGAREIGRDGLLDQDRIDSEGHHAN